MWDLGEIVAGVTSADVWATLVARHEALFCAVAPPVVGVSRVVSLSGVTAQDVYRWRVRGDGDELAVVTRVVASHDVGTAQLTVTSGAGSGTTTVTSAAERVYHLVTPASAGGVTECVLAATESGGELRIVDVASYLLTVPIAERLAAASGAMPGPPAVTGWPVTSEYVARMVNLPGQVARDRPACVFSHVGVIGADLTGKTHGLADPEAWGAEGVTEAASSALVGRGWVPRLSELGRRVVVDVYFDRTDLGRGELKVAGATPILLAASGWSSHVLEAPADGGEVRATVHLDGEDAARFVTVQVWRAQG